MSKLDKKIEKLISDSLFLDDERIKKIQKALKRASDSEKKKLIKILESEQKALSGIIQKYIKENGQGAIDELDHLLNKMKGIIRGSKENTETKKDKEKMDKLLDELGEE